jgi:hypothetical protein
VVLPNATVKFLRVRMTSHINEKISQVNSMADTADWNGESQQKKLRFGVPTPQRNIPKGFEVVLDSGSGVNLWQELRKLISFYFGGRVRESRRKGRELPKKARECTEFFEKTVFYVHVFNTIQYFLAIWYFFSFI